MKKIDESEFEWEDDNYISSKMMTVGVVVFCICLIVFSCCILYIFK